MNYTEQTEDECQAMCLRHGECKSINFDSSTGKCQLNTDIAGGDRGSIVSKAGWKYKQTNFTLDKVPLPSSLCLLM